MKPCLLWDGPTNGKAGYGTVEIRGKRWLVHRLIWTHHYGPIPKGMKVLHKCDRPLCWEITHLQLGTQKENLADMTMKGRRRNQNTGRTHCKRGHEFTPENTGWSTDGRRGCRACRRKETKLQRRSERNGNTK